MVPRQTDTSLRREEEDGITVAADAVATGGAYICFQVLCTRARMNERKHLVSDLRTSHLSRRNLLVTALMASATATLPGLAHPRPASAQAASTPVLGTALDAITADLEAFVTRRMEELQVPGWLSGSSRETTSTPPGLA